MRRGLDAPSTVAYDDAEHRWADLARLALVISREIQNHGYHDPLAATLTRSEAVVICHLLRGGSATPSQIAAATGLLRPNVSTALRTLRTKGLIEKTSNPVDGRGFTIQLTAQGRAGYELVRGEWATTVATAANHDTTDLEAAIAVLTKVMNGLANNRSAGASPTAD